MNSILTANMREEFLLRLYFNDSDGFFLAGINRAFLDLSRTLPIKDEYREKHKEESRKFLLKVLKIVLTHKFESQTSFDRFHRESCENLIETWKELSYGHSQKWINMTLKYWLLFGDDRINGIETNAQYFHIPIDSYVLEGMFPNEKYIAWSKIDNYKKYMHYQNLHRKKKTGNYPIIDEFNFFNKYKS